MKVLLAIGISFLVGSLFGSIVATRAYRDALRNVSLEQVAERAVREIADAYESQLSRSITFSDLRDKINECAADNLKLKKRIWGLEKTKVRECSTSM